MIAIELYEVELWNEIFNLKQIIEWHDDKVSFINDLDVLSNNEI